MARPKDTGMKQGILSAAFRIFGERGFGGTTIKQIAGALEISPGSVYTYFSGKEDLFRCVVEQGWRDFLEEIRNIATAPKRLKERFEDTLDYCFKSLRQALPLLRGMLFDSRQRRLLQRNLELLCQLLEHLIVESLERGPHRVLPLEEHVRTQIRINVFGVLSSVALAQEEAQEEEIEAVKGAVKYLLYRRLQLEDNS